MPPASKFNVPILTALIFLVSISLFLYNSNASVIEKHTVESAKQVEDINITIKDMMKILQENQRRTEVMIVELKHTRQTVKDHCDGDAIRSASDVRDALREN